MPLRTVVALGSAALLGLFAALYGATAPAPAPVNSLPTTPQQPTEITSDRLDMKSTDKETTSTLTGNVVVIGTGIRITCDHLVVVSSRIGDKDDTVGKQDRFRSLVATGHVRIRQGDREAICGRAVVLPREDKITLYDDPVVMDHGSNLVTAGEEIEMLRGEREVKVKKVRMTGPVLRNLGFDPNKPAPKAAPADSTDPVNPSTGASATPSNNASGAQTPPAANPPASTPPPVTVPGLQKPDSTK